MTVYVLRMGSYSDEMMGGVFSSEEKAIQVFNERFAKNFGEDNFYVVPVDLDDENYEDF